MAILNLENLVINRTVIGINCQTCGGFLSPVKKGNIRTKIIMLVTLGTVKSKRYQCAGCNKIYTVI